MYRYIPSYSTESERDSLITSPVEGRSGYISNSTMYVAGGDTAEVTPGTGYSLYSTFGWVATGPVAAKTDAAGTTTSTSYTQTLSGTPGTNPSVTLETGTTAQVTIDAYATNSTANINTYVGFDVSGATTIAAQDSMSLIVSPHAADYQFKSSVTCYVEGLTPGTNTFTLAYRVEANTGTVQERTITVSSFA